MLINDTFLLNDFLNLGDVRHQMQIRNYGDLRIQLYATTHCQHFVHYRAMNTLNGSSCDLCSSLSLCISMNKLLDTDGSHLSLT